MRTGWRHLHRAAKWSAAAVLSMGLLGGPLVERAPAIDIVLVYDDVGLNPNFDSDGSQLTAIVTAAAAMWEDIIEDNFVVTWTYRWETVTGGFIAQHPPGLSVFDPMTGRETSGLIRFNPTTAWWIDPTPTNNSEFLMQSQIYGRDFTANQQTNWFTGSVPSNFEGAFSGTVSPGAPAAASAGADLFSTAVHEMGHGLGLTSAGTNAPAETMDLDWDLPTNMVNGNSMAVQVGSNTANGLAHVANLNALMCSCTLTGIRRLPSATDVLAMAGVSNWTAIDLPNKHFLSGNGWATAGNWLGNMVPDSQDDVYLDAIAFPQNVTLSGFSVAATLLIESGNTLDTLNNTLSVNRDVTILDSGSMLRVSGTGVLDARDIAVDDSAVLEMAGGSIDARSIDIQNGAQLRGRGTIELILALSNDAILNATGGTLTLNSDAALAFNLDGSTGQGRVFANGNGHLVVQGDITNSFTSLMVVEHGSSVTFDSIGFAPTGDLEFDSAVNQFAVFNADSLEMEGAISVSGAARINASMTYAPTATTNLQSPTSRLIITGSTALQGGFFSGSGLLQFNGPVVVIGTTMMDVHAVDLDGPNENNFVTIDPGVTLSMEIDRIDIDELNADGFDGTLNINGGTLHIETADETPWRLEGSMNMRSFGADIPVVSGTPMTVFGLINVDGQALIASDVNFRSSANVSLPSEDDDLILTGETNYRGGSYTGKGRLGQYGDAVVATSTTISVGTYDMDGAGNSTITVIPSITFVVNAARIDDADPSVDGFDGTLNIDGARVNINTTLAWRLDGELNLEHDFFNGDAILGGTKVIVHGDISSGGGSNTIEAGVEFRPSAQVVVDSGSSLRLMGDTVYFGGSYTGLGRLVQGGDALVVQNTDINTATMDWDGAENSETFINPGVRLTINSSTIDVGAPATDGYDGHVTISGGRLVVNTTEAWRLDGQMTLINSGTVSGSPMDVHGSIHSTGFINGIFSDIQFRSTAQVTVPNADQALQLLGHTTYSGGSYTGNGILMQFGDALVNANTTIDVAIFDWDGGGVPSNTTVFATTLRINSTQIDVGDPAVNGYNGHATLNRSDLDVRTDAAWVLDGQITMTLSRILGSGLINRGLVLGDGSILNEAYTNTGTTTATQGVLIINPRSFPDLDGEFGDGFLNAETGDLLVPGDNGALAPFGGTLSVATTHEFRMLHHGLLNRGRIFFQGGEYEAPALTHIGRMQASLLESFLITDALIAHRSDTVIDSMLTIIGHATIESTASMTGTGIFRIAPGSVVDGNANVEVTVLNEGVLNPGNSAGQFNIYGDYENQGDGILLIELGGYVAGVDHDHLFVKGEATLGGGSVAVQLLDLFIPTPGDRFTIMSYGSRDGGEFDGVLNQTPKAGLILDLIYDDIMGTVTLTVDGLPGDADLNGCVSIGDLTILAENFGLNDGTATWFMGDFNGDGNLGIGDLTLLAEHFGECLPEPLIASAATSAVPLPSAFWGGLGLLGLAVRRSRRSAAAAR